MAKETCSNCYVKLAPSVPFCPSCHRPTRHANDSERLQWDLGQWRAHVDRSVSVGMNPTGTAVGFGAAASVAVAPQPAPVQAPAEKIVPRIVPMPDPVVERDRDHEFAYRTCATCDQIDWIVRYSQNDDETWNYWCVRCARSFKTEVRLAQALKPFLSAGIVVGGLTAASLLLFR